jgi:hypothetical protein
MFSCPELVHGQASRIARSADPCCDLEGVQGVVWYGLDSTMTIQKFAEACAPILWFSPDEPLLLDATGKDIRLPEPFPFEEKPDAPVAYYRIRMVIGDPDAPGPAYTIDTENRSQSIIDLRYARGVELDYFFYYSSEEGFSGHKHDVESVEMKVGIGSRDCEHCRYGFAVVRVNAKAHGILWYDNTLETDVYSVFPMTILVEEGKHASCTDKNGDGYYTPGYDVNKRINDAWGVRDVIRGGTLGSGGFQNWMAKVRRPEHRVFPPLPDDSPLRRWHRRNGVYAPDNAIYELRPFPHPDLAADDPHLVPFIADKGDPDWPEVIQDTELHKFQKWVTRESFVRSLSIAYRYDGDNGVSFVFPFFIFWNFEDPMAGGWIVHRLYLKDHRLRDIAWNVLYTTSASRWIDGYVAAGAEWDKGDDGRYTWFVIESGIKFRANIGHSAFRFLSKLGTDFWGARVGIKYSGRNAWDITKLGLAVEIGAGSW